MAGVAAEQAMVAEQPQVAGLRRRLIGWRREVVGGCLAGLDGWRCQLREHRREGLGVDRDVGQERPQLLVVGAGHRRQWIEAGQDEGLLLWVEVDVAHGHRRLATGESEFDPKVAIDQAPGAAVDEDRADPSHPVEDTGERLLLRLRMGPPVQFVGDDRRGPRCRSLSRRSRRWRTRRRRRRHRGGPGVPRFSPSLPTRSTPRSYHLATRRGPGRESGACLRPVGSQAPPCRVHGAPGGPVAPTGQVTVADAVCVAIKQGTCGPAS